jgi:hypothetical protein
VLYEKKIGVKVTGGQGRKGVSYPAGDILEMTIKMLFERKDYATALGQSDRTWH